MPSNLTPRKQRLREKIQEAKILDRLIKHFNGELDLSNTQVNVGLKLLAKQLPDLKHVENSGEIIKKVIVDAETSTNIATAVRELLTQRIS